MKRFSSKEFLLLCAPIALIIVGAGLIRAIRPPRDPKSKVQLIVQQEAANQAGKVAFAWKATTQGGPEWYQMLGYAHRVVAKGHGRSQVIFDDPGTPGKPLTGTWSWGVGTTLNANAEPYYLGKQAYAAADDLPVWTQKLEWQGDFVAAPATQNSVGKWAAMNRAQLDQLAGVRGATRIKKSFPIRLPGGKVEPIRRCLLEPVNPSNAKEGADVCVTTQLLDKPRKFHRRLFASDGQQTRILWQDSPDINSPYWKSEGGSGWTPIWNSYLLFQLKDVPVAWGEILFTIDAVYDPASQNTTGPQAVDAATVTKFKKLGWIHSSRRLVVRKKGDKIVPRIIKQTPNTQLLGVKTSLTPKYWSIDAQLRYVGKDINARLDGLDTSDGPEFFKPDGSYDGLRIESYNIKRGTKGKEWLLHIDVPRANLQRKRVVQLRMDIADMDAVPLKIKENLQIPVAN